MHESIAEEKRRRSCARKKIAKTSGADRRGRARGGDERSFERRVGHARGHADRREERIPACRRAIRASAPAASSRARPGRPTRHTAARRFRGRSTSRRDRRREAARGSGPPMRGADRATPSPHRSSSRSSTHAAPRPRRRWRADRTPVSTGRALPRRSMSLDRGSAASIHGCMAATPACAISRSNAVNAV